MTQTLKNIRTSWSSGCSAGLPFLAIVLLHNLEHYNLFFIPGEYACMVAND